MNRSWRALVREIITLACQLDSEPTFVPVANLANKGRDSGSRGADFDDFDWHNVHPKIAWCTRASTVGVKRFDSARIFSVWFM
jgi:hypothetical protein